MSQETVEALAEAFRAGQRAFNEGDFETAFAALAEDVEWHFGPWVPDGGVIRSREALIRYYEGLQDAGEWQAEPQEFIDAGEGRVVVHQRGRWVGRTTQIEGTRDSFLLWEMGADGFVFRVREYESRQEAFDAAALRE